jgi:5'-3' exonuclease
VGTKPDNLLLLDTASLYYRAFFGIPESLKAPNGLPVNAVRGLLDFISTLLEQYESSGIACCWDNDWRPTWRVDLIPSYKAHRVQASNDPELVGAEETPPMLEHQVPVIREVMGAFGLPVVGVDDFEADDVIGTLTASSTIPVNIVTGDRDLFQLVDDDRAVKVLYTVRGVKKHEVIDSAAVHDRYGIDPSTYVDFAVLRGDPSDGLPGIKGVGDKTAARLINQFGSLDEIINAANANDPVISATLALRLLDERPYLEAAKKVVAVDRAIGIEDLDLTTPRQPADATTLYGLADVWGLGSSVDRLVRVLANR